MLTASIIKTETIYTNQAGEVIEVTSEQKLLAAIYGDQPTYKQSKKTTVVATRKIKTNKEWMALKAELENLGSENSMIVS